MNAPEDVMDSMIDDDQTLFVKFVVLKINDKIQEIVKDYNDDDIYEHILSSVINYTKYSSLSIVDGKIIFSL